jgi:hypothetical protein
MEKENLKLLKWFVDFAGTEVGKLDYGEMVKLTAEVHLLLANGLWNSYGHSSLFEQARRLSSKYDEKAFERVDQLQRNFRADFDNILPKVDEVRESQHLDKWTSANAVSALSSIRVPAPEVLFSPRVSLHLPVQFKDGEKEFLYRGKPDWRANATFSIVSESESPSEAILLALFLKCLNGVRVSAFARCKECKKWFIHSTKRKREYCSNLCAARRSNRDRRAREKAKDSESHKRELGQGAKRARKSYEKRVKNLLPGAKPGRRPRKRVAHEGKD